ncbi:MAG: ArsC/Spx/MgsR family protein, partial [Psychroflexus salarius]
GLQLLEEANVEFEIVKYLNEVPSTNEIESILKKLNKTPIELVRTNEKIWKENFKGKDLSDQNIIEAMHSFPKLIERPIVINNQNAVIGRPPEKIKSII